MVLCVSKKKKPYIELQYYQHEIIKKDFFFFYNRTFFLMTSYNMSIPETSKSIRIVDNNKIYKIRD